MRPATARTLRGAAMKIPLHDILGVSTDLEYAEPVDELNATLRAGQSSDYEFAAPLDVRVTFYRAELDLFFDGSFHIPLIIREPRLREGAGRRVDRFTEAVDVMPTLLQASGVQIPEGVQGQSLMPLVSESGNGGSSNGDGWRARPAISEKAKTSSASVGAPPPNDTESFAITAAPMITSTSAITW